MNDQCPMTNERTRTSRLAIMLGHWSLVIGISLVIASLVIGHWSLVLRAQQHAAHLQSQGKLLSVIIARRNFHRFDFQRERVFFNFVQKARQRLHAPEGIGPAL